MTDIEVADGLEIVDRVTDAFFALDGTWRFTYLNDRAEEMLDPAGRGLLGEVIWDVFPETAHTPFPSQFHDAMDEQCPVAFETFYNPLETWFEVRAYPAEDGLSVYLRDITERKRQESEANQHAAIVEAVHDGVITLDDDNEITYVNRAVEATLGVPRERLVGKHVSALPRIATIDGDSADTLDEALDDLRESDAPERRLEVTFEMADQSTRVGEIRMVPIPGTNTDSVAGVIREVTDRHEYERVVTSLHDVTRHLFQAETRDDICAVAVHTASELLDLPISGVWLLDEERDRLEPVAATAGAHEVVGGLPQFGRNEGLIWDAYLSGESALFDDLKEEEGKYNPETPIRSELIVPIGDHGVLMTGAQTVGAFDERDRELAEILAANTALELDRTEREQLLSERETALSEQTERLQALETLLDGHAREKLETALGALDDVEDERAEDARSALAAADRLVGDATELSTGRAALGSRTFVDVSDAVDDAGERVAADETVPVSDVTVTVAEDATLRADRDRLVRLFETLFRWSEAGTTADVRVGLLAEAKARSVADGGYPGGIYVERADATPPEDVRTVTDPDADGPIGPAIAREIAQAHGWTLVAAATPDGTLRFEVADITTLEPTAE
ncbi:PAS domain-containing protein [Halostella sp. JP-L12]|uniref:sensor histidine kinase n=1 Tax=Halostella TaxID=1843185 RepID=UPI000EF7C8ED|nr:MULTISPECIES: PAS domain-containing protein [Halostella]NHN49644.1 PAS domain-containing protein [Halostella sp. JP-L12]